MKHAHRLSLVALLSWCLAPLGGAASSFATEASANRIAIEKSGDGCYALRASVADYLVQKDALVCELEGALRVDPVEADELPGFVVMFEVPSGRSAVIEDLSLQSRSEQLAATRVWKSLLDEPLTVDFARMGGRAFMRVEFHPFYADPQSGALTVYQSVSATLRVLESDPARPRLKNVVKSSSSGNYPFDLACPPRMPVGVSAGDGAPGDYAAHRSVTNDVAWKILVSQPGLYRITGEVLSQAGVPAAFRDASQLRISVRDQVVPVWRSTSGVMQSNDWIMFYGAAVDSVTTTQNVYWLSTGTPSPAPTIVNVPTSSVAPVVTATWSMVEFAPDAFYRSAYNPLEDAYDHWFALEVRGNSTSNIPFATPNPVGTGLAYVAYTLHGVNFATNNPDHRSEFKVGTAWVATNTYDDEIRVTGTSSVPASVLSLVTTVAVRQVQLPGVSQPDYGNAYVESLRLYYQRQLVVSNTPYFFSGPATSATLRIKGVPTNPFWLLDVSDPAQALELGGYTLQTNAGSRILSFTDQTGGGNCYALLSSSTIYTVSSMELVRFRNLSEAGRQADYLALAPTAFRTPVYRLLKHRHKNGLSVQVATPDDVYNEFSYGVVDAVALRHYVGFAYHHYVSPKPAYALFVGTGSYDPLNTLGKGDVDIIPTRIAGAFKSRTATEQWFVTVDGSDLLPDLALGRITATNVAEVTRAVGKIIAFETASTNGPWYETALLVADNTDNFKSFTATNTKVHLEAGGFESFNIGTAYLDDTAAASIRLSIQTYLNSGGHLLHYMGHGSVGKWAQEDLWNRTNAIVMANTNYPIVMVFSCQVGAFHEPGDPCLADAIVLSAGAGSGCVAPSALSVQLYAQKLADGFYEALAEDRVPRLGDALQAGLLKLYHFNPNVSELKTYVIIGDPAQLIWGGAIP